MAAAAEVLTTSTEMVFSFLRYWSEREKKAHLEGYVWGKVVVVQVSPTQALLGLQEEGDGAGGEGDGDGGRPLVGGGGAAAEPQHNQLHQLPGVFQGDRRRGIAARWGGLGCSCAHQNQERAEFFFLQKSIQKLNKELLYSSSFAHKNTNKKRYCGYTQNLLY